MYPNVLCARICVCAKGATHFQNNTIFLNAAVMAKRINGGKDVLANTPSHNLIYAKSCWLFAADH